MENLIVSIDGLDGSGKTTICEYLISKLKKKYSVIKVVGVIDKYVDKLAYNSYSIDTKYLYYLASFIDSMMKKCSEHKGVIILDRSIYSTIAYHNVYGSKIDINNIFDIFIEPDIRIFLSTTMDVIKQRLMERSKIDWYEEKLIKDLSLGKKIETQYRDMGLQKVDATDINKAKNIVLSIIKDFIESNKNTNNKGNLI